MGKRILSYFIKHITYLVALMWVFSMAVAVLEIYFYPGFVYKHTSVDPLFVYLVFGGTGLLLQLDSGLEKNRFFLTFRKLGYFATFFFGLAYIIINLIEKIKYPNYIFSTYHINPLQLSTLATLSIYTGVISSKKIELDTLANGRTLIKENFPIIVFLLWIILLNIFDVGTTAAQNLFFMIKNPSASYNQKMEQKIGKQVYDYILFIKENTPENSKLFLPPFPAYPWPQTGNITYMRYFLYPRTLLNGDEYSANYDLKNNNIDYVLIAWGETDATQGSYTHGWPKFDVKSDQVVYMLKDGGIQEKKGDYIYKNVVDKELWGLIKVKK